MIKTCSKCKTEKPATLEFFSAEKRIKSGLNSWCRDCRNNKVKDHHVTDNGKQQVATAVSKYNGSAKHKIARKRYEDKKKQINK